LVVQCSARQCELRLIESEMENSVGSQISE